MSQPPVIAVVSEANAPQAALIEGMRDVLEPAGVPLIGVTTDPDQPALAPTLRWAVHATRPRGVIMVTLTRQGADEQVEDYVQAVGLPIVYLGATRPGACVLTDNAPGMRQLMRHLLATGPVRRPVLLRGLVHHADSVEREGIIREELAAAGVPPHDILVIEGGFRRDAAFAAMRRLLTQRRDLDTVIAFNDQSAFGALDALQRAGLRVPQDVVVTGFDDEEGAQLSDPPLTTATQSLRVKGAAAARLLLELSEGRPGRTVTVPTRMVVRRSTREVPHDAGGAAPDADGAAPDAGGAAPDAGGAAPDVISREVVTRLWGDVTVLQSCLALSRDFHRCTDRDQVMQSLATALTWVGAVRCFVVLYQKGPLEDTGEVTLVLQREAGWVQPEPGTAEGTPFPAEQLLPPSLADELTRGYLSLIGLTTERAQVGHVLLELAGSDQFVSDAVQRDLVRTLDRMASNAAIAAHAHNLERLVAERTEELQVEVGLRRRQERELQRLNADLRLRLHQDGLTGICNRIGFDAELLRQWQTLSRVSAPLSLLMIDVDHFKLYNDAHGHLAGDECLKKVARCLDDSMNRPHDIVARYGGEEFAAVLPNVSSSGAVQVASRIRAALAHRAIPHESSPHGQVTVSIGVATTYPGALPDPTSLVAEADAALYLAKASGRDRCVVSEGGVPVG